MGSIGTAPSWTPDCDVSFKAMLARNTNDKALMYFLAALEVYLMNKVEGGAVTSAPTNASTQATGATGATVMRCNVSAIDAIVNGVRYAAAAQADLALHDTTVYTGADSGAGDTTLTSGKSAIVAIVLKNASGTVSQVIVKGATATTGAQVAPTDAEITTKCEVATWIKIGEVLINRTADTTVTQTYTDKRPAWGQNYATAMAGAVAAS